MKDFYHHEAMFAKPTLQHLIKGRKERHERDIKQDVRAQCVERDGACRFQTYREDVMLAVGPCDGPSQWAHFADKKRARTRNMPPEVRHTSQGSFMACEKHHTAYDAGRLQIDALTADGADGLLRAGADGHWCEV